MMNASNDLYDRLRPKRAYMRSSHRKDTYELSRKGGMVSLPLIWVLPSSISDFICLSSADISGIWGGCRPHYMLGELLCAADVVSCGRLGGCSSGKNVVERCDRRFLQATFPRTLITFPTHPVWSRRDPASQGSTS